MTILEAKQLHGILGRLSLTAFPTAEELAFFLDRWKLLSDDVKNHDKKVNKITIDNKLEFNDKGELASGDIQKAKILLEKLFKKDYTYEPFIQFYQLNSMLNGAITVNEVETLLKSNIIYNIVD